MVFQAEEMAVIFQSLEHTSHLDIITVLNEAFREYVVPIQMSEEDFARKVSQEDVDLSRSVGAFVDGHLVGFIVKGWRGTSAYNAVTGVLPAWRGQRLTQQMYHWWMQQHQPEVQYLEVMQSNSPAISSYEAIGFRKTREVYGYKLPFPLQVNSCATYRLVPLPQLPEATRHWWDYTPTWSFQWPSLLNVWPEALTLGVEEKGQLIGCLAVLPGNGRMLHLSVHPDFRRQQVATHLLQAAQQRIQQGISIINLSPDYQPGMGLMATLKAQEFFRQWEMVWGC